jgi:hypothetical protein
MLLKLEFFSCPQKILDFYEVNSKIICATADNAANEKKAIWDMGMFVIFIHHLLHYI